MLPFSASQRSGGKGEYNFPDFIRRMCDFRQMDFESAFDQIFNLLSFEPQRVYTSFYHRKREYNWMCIVCLALYYYYVLLLHDWLALTVMIKWSFPVPNNNVFSIIYDECDVPESVIINFIWSSPVILVSVFVCLSFLRNKESVGSWRPCICCYSTLFSCGKWYRDREI